MVSLEGKVAIVTGASSGIGRAIAERLGKDGASVIVNYASNQEKAEETVAKILAMGANALTVQADLSRVSEIHHLFKQTISYFGQLDILVNNAGIILTKPVVEVTQEDFDKVFAVNTRGTFFALQEAARRIKDGGRIVNISSISSANAWLGQAIYSASKAAVEQFTKILSKELGPRGITVNTVSPGATETNMMSAEVKEIAPKMTALGRVGQPADIADVVAFLVSKDARWITGENIRATGGLG